MVRVRSTVSGLRVSVRVGVMVMLNGTYIYIDVHTKTNKKKSVLFGMGGILIRHLPCCVLCHVPIRTEYFQFLSEKVSHIANIVLWQHCFLLESFISRSDFKLDKSVFPLFS